jgi:MFS family permease
MEATATVTEWEAKGYGRPARRLRGVLFGAMCLSSAPTLAMATVNSIVIAQIGGSAAWAGVPTALILLGSAVSAPVWGVASDRIGRRGALSVGLVFGVVGSLVAGTALVRSSPWPFLLGLGIVGTTSAAVLLSRFAAGEVHPRSLRAGAISTVVLGGAVGSILGPLIVAPSGLLASTRGVDELAGPYAAAIVLYAVAAAVSFALLRPEPRDLGRVVAALEPEEINGAAAPARPVLEILRGRLAGLAVAAMVFGQVVMIMVMVMTSLHMRSHHHDLGAISLVIASHTFGMYAFSVVSGRLADRRGRVSVIAFGAAMLVLACLAAPLSTEVVPLAASLFVLGLGWNFCFVAGSALLADQLRPAERARTQGVNDMLVGIASAVGSLGSGVVFAAVGYAAMATVGAMVALVPLTLALAWRRVSPAPA